MGFWNTQQGARTTEKFGELSSGVIGAMHRPFGRAALVRTYFIAPQLDTPFWYLLLVAPRWTER